MYKHKLRNEHEFNRILASKIPCLFIIMFEKKLFLTSNVNYFKCEPIHNSETLKCTHKYK